MAAGRPVVTTSLINDGLGAQPDKQILVADDARATARQIARLLADPALRERIGSAGRRFVEQRYSWAHALARMRAIEEHLKQGHHPA
jgi:glycosyltransferase involved in cell wall biosynthesis